MNYCITVFGCKKYQDVAHLFVKELDFWNSNLLDSTYFFTDEFIENLEMDQVVINEESSWSMRVAKSLMTIEVDYILFLLDDYIIQEELNMDHIEMLVGNAKIFGMKYCRLLDIPSDSSFGNLRPIKVSNYGINLQPAIWDRRFFINALENINANPWITEISLHKYFDIKSGSYQGAFGYRFIDNYLNAVIKGKWSRRVPRDLIGYSDRLIMSKREWLSYKVKGFLSSSLNDCLKSLLKIILKKMGFNFYS
jgi:hypothetical protein